MKKGGGYKYYLLERKKTDPSSSSFSSFSNRSGGAMLAACREGREGGRDGCGVRLFFPLIHHQQIECNPPPKQTRLD